MDGGNDNSIFWKMKKKVVFKKKKICLRSLLLLYRATYIVRQI